MFLFLELCRVCVEIGMIPFNIMVHPFTLFESFTPSVRQLTHNVFLDCVELFLGDFIGLSLNPHMVNEAELPIKYSVVAQFQSNNVLQRLVLRIDILSHFLFVPLKELRKLRLTVIQVCHCGSADFLPSTFVGRSFKYAIAVNSTVARGSKPEMSGFHVVFLLDFTLYSSTLSIKSFLRKNPHYETSV